MQFEADKKQILESLKTVAPAVAKRSSLPILQAIRVEAKGGEVAFQATDLEVAVTARTHVISSEDAGVVVLAAQQLKKAVEALEGPGIRVETNPEKADEAKLTSGVRSVHLTGLSQSDWPKMADTSGNRPVCTINAQTLTEALGKVVVCASQDEARPVLTGVQFTIKAGSSQVELAATDSYRLGSISIQGETQGTAETTLIVPARVLKAMAKTLAKEEGKATVSIVEMGDPKATSGLVDFSFGETTWLVREIEGDFPEWRKLIPEQEGGRFNFDPAELAEGIKGAAALRSSGQTPVRIHLDDECSIRMVDGPAVTLRQELQDARYSPNGTGPMEIAFNPDFLKDALAFVAKHKGTMWVKDATKPAVFPNGHGSYVLMPVRLPA